MNIIFDGNYLYHKCFSVFSTYYKNEDICIVLQDKEKQQILIRKCIIDLCSAVNRFCDIEKVIVVIDSRSWRYDIYDDYKYALTRVKEDYYQYFLKILNLFEKLLRKRGLIVSKVEGAEGDDLIYFWSLYFDELLNQKVVIVTGDSDIRQICSKNISVFNNNSKNLRIFCLEENKKFWDDYFYEELNVEVVNPFEIFLYKVIIGDTSDNIIKLKKGFGQKAFEKFIESIIPYVLPEKINVDTISKWITDKFQKYTEDDDLFVKVRKNVNLVWLNISVYKDQLIEDIFQDINIQKDKYIYSKKYTLENFYGFVIK